MRAHVLPSWDEFHCLWKTCILLSKVGKFHVLSKQQPDHRPSGDTPGWKDPWLKDSDNGQAFSVSPTPAVSVLHCHPWLVYSTTEGHGFGICGLILILSFLGMHLSLNHLPQTKGLDNLMGATQVPSSWQWVKPLIQLATSFKSMWSR